MDQGLSIDTVVGVSKTILIEKLIRYLFDKMIVVQEVQMLSTVWNFTFKLNVDIFRTKHVSNGVDSLANIGVKLHR